VRGPVLRRRRPPRPAAARGRAGPAGAVGHPARRGVPGHGRTVLGQAPRTGPGNHLPEPSIVRHSAGVRPDPGPGQHLSGQRPPGRRRPGGPPSGPAGPGADLAAQRHPAPRGHPAAGPASTGTWAARWPGWPSWPRS
jgi:hypothetical protein